MPQNSIAACPDGIEKAKQALKRKGLSRQKLAGYRECNLSRSTIDNFFNGKAVSNESFVSLCKVLELDFDEIAGIPQASRQVNEHSAPLRELLTETINIDSQSFEFYITILSDYDYWQESSKPIREQYPFEYPCKQYFHLNKDFFVENIHPYFDITFLNKRNEPILLTHVGIEIVSVCHLVYDYGTPESIEVKIQSSQIIIMPDIIAKLGNQHMRHSYLKPPPPVNLNEVISVKMSSPFYLQHQAPFRYTLLLEKYQEHMPNNSILRMWAKTSNGIEFRSHDIHLFTL